eukprot:EG_transcript_2592
MLCSAAEDAEDGALQEGTILVKAPGSERALPESLPHSQLAETLQATVPFLPREEVHQAVAAAPELLRVPPAQLAAALRRLADAAGPDMARAILTRAPHAFLPGAADAAAVCAALVDAVGEAGAVDVVQRQPAVLATPPTHVTATLAVLSQAVGEEAGRWAVRRVPGVLLASPQALQRVLDGVVPAVELNWGVLLALLGCRPQWDSMSMEEVVAVVRWLEATLTPEGAAVALEEAPALLTLSVAELSHRARLLEEVGGRPMPAVDWRLLLRPPDQIQAAFRQLCGILGPERARVTVAEDWSVLWADLDGIVRMLADAVGLEHVPLLAGHPQLLSLSLPAMQEVLAMLGTLVGPNAVVGCVAQLPQLFGEPQGTLLQRRTVLWECLGPEASRAALLAVPTLLVADVAGLQASLAAVGALLDAGEAVATAVGEAPALLTLRPAALRDRFDELRQLLGPQARAAFQANPALLLHSPMETERRLQALCDVVGWDVVVAAVTTCPGVLALPLPAATHLRETLAAIGGPDWAAAVLRATPRLLWADWQSVHQTVRTLSQPLGLEAALEVARRVPQILGRAAVGHVLQTLSKLLAPEDIAALVSTVPDVLLMESAAVEDVVGVLADTFGSAGAVQMIAKSPALLQSLQPATMEPNMAALLEAFGEWAAAVIQGNPKLLLLPPPEVEGAARALVELLGRQRAAALALERPVLLEWPLRSPIAALTRGVGRAGAASIIENDTTLLQVAPSNLGGALRVLTEALQQHGAVEAVQRHPALLGTPPLTLRQAIATLVEVLGRDKARAAIQSHPALLTYAAVDNFGQSVQALQQLLGRPVATQLLLSQPDLLFSPVVTMEERVQELVSMAR